MTKKVFTICFITLISLSGIAQVKPLKVRISGLTHSHLHGILGRKDLSDIQIVGIADQIVSWRNDIPNSTAFQ